MDESEAYNHGKYKTYEDALIAAKAIVEEFFVNNWKSGVTGGYLLGQYCLYGEDPTYFPTNLENIQVSPQVLMQKKFMKQFVKNFKGENGNTNTLPDGNKICGK